MRAFGTLIFVNPLSCCRGNADGAETESRMHPNLEKAIYPMAFFDVLYLISRIKPNRIPAFGENSLDMEENGV